MVDRWTGLPSALSEWQYWLTCCFQEIKAFIQEEYVHPEPQKAIPPDVRSGCSTVYSPDGLSPPAVISISRSRFAELIKNCLVTGTNQANRKKYGSRLGKPFGKR
jgi:hypothetical protein